MLKKTDDAEALLQSHGIRRTRFRIELLALLIQSEKPLSHQQIKEKVSATQDKVTIYRALQTFMEKGLIHKVHDVQNTHNVSKYAMCPSQCSEKAHKHNHVHFICDSCEETFCLDNVSIPTVSLPKGYQAKTNNFTVVGVCNQCSVK